MSHFRSIFRQISANNSYQVSNYGPRNNQFYTFKPSDIGGLTGWWDASDTAYITESRTANDVQYWSNKGTAGGYISGGLGGTMTTIPAYKNGRQAIYFKTSSASSYWQTSINIDALDGATTRCWFLVFQSNPTLRPDSFGNAYDNPTLIMDRFLNVNLTEGTKYPGTDVARWYFDGTETGYLEHLSSSDTSGKNPASGSNFILNVMARSPSSRNNYLTMSVNGGTDDTRISAGFMATPARPFGIGSGPSSPSASTPRNRYFYEILFYTGTLTSAERTKVINYLNDKWAIY